MAKYGLQLVAVELSTIAGIYMIRLIIDFLHEQKAPHAGYNWLLFLSFNFFRLMAILIRNYYDLHVYNFFRYVQTAIQGWIFEDISKLRLWTKIGAVEGDEDKNKKIKDQEA